MIAGKRCSRHGIIRSCAPGEKKLLLTDEPTAGFQRKGVGAATGRAGDGREGSRLRWTSWTLLVIRACPVSRTRLLTSERLHGLSSPRLDTQPWFESCPSHFQDGWSWVKSLTSLYLSFPVCKLWMLEIPPTASDDGEFKVFSLIKQMEHYLVHSMLLKLSNLFPRY